MITDTISITGLSSISALGANSEGIWENYLSPDHRLSYSRIGDDWVWAGELATEEDATVAALQKSNNKYRNLDRSVLFALYASREAIKQAGWNGESTFGINLGSSRGATQLFERYHQEFVQQGKVSPLSSPTTTLGNISSWVAHDLNTRGPVISHSITCSTALHAVLNAVAWLQSGLTDKFLVGGSEAPLTPFTVAQMKALKLYAASGKDIEYPCHAMDKKKSGNTMVLGEAAGVACLEAGSAKHALATIQGVGYATETLNHNVSISADAKCFQESMKMALGRLSPQSIDCIVMHAPGTVKGDSSEFEAIAKVFGDRIPYVTNNKWKLGHTFGASGILSLEMAIFMLQHQKYIPHPFGKQEAPEGIRNVLLNAVGFGGNAVSILLAK